jgi:hypothetical protein
MEKITKNFVFWEEDACFEIRASLWEATRRDEYEVTTQCDPVRTLHEIIFRAKYEYDEKCQAILTLFEKDMKKQAFEYMPHIKMKKGSWTKSTEFEINWQKILVDWNKIFWDAKYFDMILDIVKHYKIPIQLGNQAMIGEWCYIIDAGDHYVARVVYTSSLAVAIACA